MKPTDPMSHNEKELLSGKFGPGEIVEALGKDVTLREMFWAFRRLILSEDSKPQSLSQTEISFYAGAITIIEIYCWTRSVKLSEAERTDLFNKIRDEIVEYGEKAPQDAFASRS
jgi:hypothetical protein